MENPTSEQNETLDKLIGRKIHDIEIFEDGPEAIVRIFLSDNDDDCIEIYAQYMQMIVISPKPTPLH